MKSIERAIEVLSNAFKNDPDFAHTWHCNIAMACYDAMGDSLMGNDLAHKISNEAASRFMKQAFDVETNLTNRDD